MYISDKFDNMNKLSKTQRTFLQTVLGYNYLSRVQEGVIKYVLNVGEYNDDKQKRVLNEVKKLYLQNKVNEKRWKWV